MSSTVLETMTLVPCRIPREKLVEMASVYAAFGPEQSDDQIAMALAELRWGWERDHGEGWGCVLPPDKPCPYPHVVCLDGRLFEVEEFRSTDDLWLSKLTEFPDGSFEYTALYYNGAAHWEELAEAEMRKLRSPDTGEGG